MEPLHKLPTGNCIDLRAARGIANGVVISVVLWAVIGYAVWCGWMRGG